MMTILICFHPTAHTRANQSAVYLWPIPILLRELHRRRRLSVPFPCPIYRQRPQQLGPLGQTRLGHPHRPMGSRSRGTQHSQRSHRLTDFLLPPHLGIRQRQQPPRTCPRPTSLPNVACPLVALCLFQPPRGKDPLPETFLSPSYPNTIQTSCPWVL